MQQDVLCDAVDSNMSDVTDMPYFDGDFWPNALEDSIKELARELAEKPHHDVASSDAWKGGNEHLASAQVKL